MKLMYLFDNKIKAYMSRGKKYCNPENTGILQDGISCIRENDVNIWFYTKNDITFIILYVIFSFGLYLSAFFAILSSGTLPFPSPNSTFTWI